MPTIGSCNKYVTIDSIDLEDIEILFNEYGSCSENHEIFVYVGNKDTNNELYKKISNDLSDTIKEVLTLYPDCYMICFYTN